MATCNCPPGYTLLEDGVTCQKVTFAVATPPETAIQIDTNLEPGNNIDNKGLLIHENITSNQNGGTKQWPIIDTPQSLASPNSLSVIPPIGPNWTSLNPVPSLPGGQHEPVNIALPSGYPPLGMPSYPTVTCLRESIVSANVLNYGVGSPVMPLIWQNNDPWYLGHWGNAIGVWPSDAGLTNYKWVGFSKCITITEPKTLYVIMACNNAFRFSVDGQLAVERNTGDGLTMALGYANAFPITLEPGTHTFYFEGFNYSGGGGFAVDLLDCSEAELLSIATLSDIIPYRVFSSLWRRPRPVTFTVSGTTITTSGQFIPSDAGGFIDSPSIPAGTYIQTIVDANTAILSASVPAASDNGTLFFVWDTGNTVENTWTCPEGYIFGNCDGPTCILIETTDCDPPPPVPCYLLTACDGSIDPIKVTNDLSAQVGKVITICPENIPQRNFPTDEGIPVQANEQMNNLNSYTLVDCCGVLPPVQVSNGLGNIGTTGTLFIPSLSTTTCWSFTLDSTFGGVNIVDLTGALYYRDCQSCTNVRPCLQYPVLTECKCVTVSLAPDCDGAITINIGPDIIPYDDCSQCAPKCYLLTNCENPQETIVTYTDLSAFVGQVIKLLTTCPDKCWSVSLAPNCDNSVSVAQTISYYIDCASCLPKVEDPVITLKTRAVRPGFYTPGCPPDYTLKVNCKFAEAVYRELLVNRFGITPCCNEDDHKWDVKKALLDLNAIYDPEACKSTLVNCCPPTCVVAEIQTFQPMSCPDPTDVQASIP